MQRSFDVEVHAAAGLQPVGIMVNEGQEVSITYLSGKWETAGPSKKGSKTADPIMPGAKVGALIGKVGQQLFQVDRKGTAAIPEGAVGELLLGINDAPRNVAKASGSLMVRVETFWPTAIVLVDAGDKWQPSGLTVQSNQRVTVSARGGRWMPNPGKGYCDAGGYGENGDEGFPLPGAPEGALIARIGKKVFQVGRGGGHVPHGAAGPLHFMANDDDPSQGHKPGHLRVEVESLATEFSVKASQDWQSTGILVGRRDQASIQATGGQWSAIPDSPLHGPAGIGKSAGKGAPMPKQPLGALVGKVGGKSFLVAEGAAVPDGLEGELKLTINADRKVLHVLGGRIHVEISGAAAVAGARPCMHLGGGAKILVTPHAHREKILTVAAWVRAHWDRRKHMVVPVLSGSDAAGLRFMLTLNPLGAIYSSNDPIDPKARLKPHVYLPDEIPTDTWMHVAFVVEEKAIRLHCSAGPRRELKFPYRDGFLEAMLTHMCIGGSDHLGAGTFDGSVAEVTLWNRALSRQEVESIADRQMRGDEPGLLQYWPLHEGRGRSVADLCRAKEGTISGPANSRADWSEEILPIARTLRKRLLARGSWQNTDVEIVQAGKKPITITAEGDVTGRADAAVHSASGELNRPAGENHPLPGHPTGALIARVGNRIVPVGKQVQLPHDVRGKLSLMLNSDPSTLHQNQGSLDVTIVVPPTTECILPHPARLFAYSGSKNSLLAQAKKKAAATIATAHQKANDKIQQAHQTAKETLSQATASLQFLFCATNSGIVRFQMQRSGPPTRKFIANTSSRFDIGYTTVEIPLHMAIDAKDRRIYWASQHEWEEKPHIDIHSARWDGSQARVDGVNIYSDELRRSSVVGAMAVDPIREVLYVLRSTWDQNPAQGNYLQTIDAHPLDNLTSRRVVATFRRGHMPGIYGFNKPNLANVFLPDIPGKFPEHDYHNRAIVATSWWMALDLIRNRMFINGRGKIWRVELSSGAVSTVPVPGRWPVAMNYDEASDTLYWIQYVHSTGTTRRLCPLGSMRSNGSAQRQIGNVMGHGLTLDLPRKRVFCAFDRGIADIDLTVQPVGTGTEMIARGPQFHHLFFEDPVASEKRLHDEAFSESNEARKAAAAEKAKIIAAAHDKANSQKQAKLKELQQKQDDANTRRAKAQKSSQGKINAKRKELAKAHDNHDKKIAAATAKAHSDRAKALADKKRKIDQANVEAAEKKAPAEKKLREARQKKRG